MIKKWLLQSGRRVIKKRHGFGDDWKLEEDDLMDVLEVNKKEKKKKKAAEKVTQEVVVEIPIEVGVEKSQDAIPEEIKVVQEILELLKKDSETGYDSEPFLFCEGIDFMLNPIFRELNKAGWQRSKELMEVSPKLNTEKTIMKLDILIEKAAVAKQIVSEWIKSLNQHGELKDSLLRANEYINTGKIPADWEESKRRLIDAGIDIDPFERMNEILKRIRKLNKKGVGTTPEKPEIVTEAGAK